MKLYTFQRKSFLPFFPNMEAETLRNAWKKMKNHIRRLIDRDITVGIEVGSVYKTASRHGVLSWGPWQEIHDKEILREMQDINDEIQMAQRFKGA